MELSNNFGWELNPKLLFKRKKYKSLFENLDTDILVIGGGLTGLSSINQLRKYSFNNRITLVDSGRIGQGSSSRNSGFLVDSTLNNGATSITNIMKYKKKYALNFAGMSALKSLVNEYKIECDWHEAGKYHAASNESQFFKLKKFTHLLKTSEISFKEYYQNDLYQILGTSFYKYAVKTKGGVLLNPQKLIQGLVLKILDNVNIFENTKIIKIGINNDPYAITSNGLKINAKKILVAINSAMPDLNIMKNYTFPLILTSSITRQLTQKECKTIGNPSPWGVLSVKPTGATVRFTNDNRIMIRNTSEPFLNSNKSFEHCIKKHRDGFNKRFPNLKNVEFENSWTGNISVSRNGNPVFGNIKGKVFFAGGYNGGGLGLSSLFGAAMVDSSMKIESDIFKIVNSYPQANLLPPFPKIAAFLRIKWDYLFGSNES